MVVESVTREERAYSVHEHIHIKYGKVTPSEIIQENEISFFMKSHHLYTIKNWHSSGISDREEIAYSVHKHISMASDPEWKFFLLIKSLYNN